MWSRSSSCWRLPRRCFSGWPPARPTGPRGGRCPWRRSSCSRPAGWSSRTTACRWPTSRRSTTGARPSPQWSSRCTRATRTPPPPSRYASTTAAGTGMWSWATGCRGPASGPSSPWTPRDRPGPASARLPGRPTPPRATPDWPLSRWAPSAWARTSPACSKPPRSESPGHPRTRLPPDLADGDARGNAGGKGDNGRPAPRGGGVVQPDAARLFSNAAR